MSNLRSIAGSVIALVLLVAAGWILHGELHDLDVRDITAALAELPRGAVLSAAALAVVNYIVMAGYDGLALRQLGRTMGAMRTLQAAFIGYAYSNNLGLQVISGTTVRYRLYSRWGLNGTELARLVIFNIAAVNLGLAALLGPTLLASAPPGILGRLPPAGVHALAAAFILLPLGYLAACLLIRGTLHIHRFELDLPRFHLGVGQILMGAVDWLLGAAVLWLLFPPGEITFLTLLAAFLLAQLLGLLSQVPGGLGVFEGTMLLLLGNEVPRDGLISALLFFRLTYYVLPLVLATAWLVLDTLPRQRLSGRFGELTRAALPRALSALVFAAGTVLLFASAAPLATDRANWLTLAAPGGVLAVLQVLATVTSVALLMLAPILLWRREAALRWTRRLLAAGIGLALLSSLHLEVALFLLTVLVLSHAARAEFRAMAPLRTAPVSPGWSLAATAVVFTVLWAGVFGFQDLDPIAALQDGTLWWPDDPEGGPERFLRAAFTAGVTLALGIGVRALGAPENAPMPLRTGPIQDALMHTGPTLSARLRLQLSGAEKALYHITRPALLPYANAGRSTIAIGDTIPDPADSELLMQFHETAGASGRQPVVLGASQALLPVSGDLGLSFLHLGDAATLRLERHRTEGARARLQGFTAALAREGAGCRLVEPDAPAHGTVCEELGRKYGSRIPAVDAAIAVIYDEAGIAGFASAVPGHGTRRTYALEWLTLEERAPAGSREALVARLIEWTAREGARTLSLGIAADTGGPPPSRASRWDRHVHALLDLDPQRAWRAAFDPRWSPRYLIHPGGLTLPRALRDARWLVERCGVRLR